MLGSIALVVLVALPSAAHPPADNAGSTAQATGAGTQATADKPWPPAGVVRIGAGIVAPRLIKEAKPRYTAAAMNAKITGRVVMEAVIETDGRVGEVRVTKSLDREFGLDDEAVRTLKTWRFEPGRKDDVAVPVLVVVEMTFTRK